MGPDGSGQRNLSMNAMHDHSGDFSLFFSRTELESDLWLIELDREDDS